MDTRAKRHMVVARRSHRHYKNADEPWSLWIQGKKIVRDLSQTVYDLVLSEEARDYWEAKDNISSEVINAINWDAIDMAMMETKRNRKVFISKHVSGMCAVGKFMQRWKMRSNSSCPRCGNHEDAAHVWTCHGQGADEVWERALSNLEGWFNSMQTDPDIQHIIIAYLKSWRDDTSEISSNSFMLEEVLEHQSSIGWQRFFEGWTGIGWERAQQAYFTLIKSRRTGKRWVVALIKKMWDIAWDLWEHRNGILYQSSNVATDAELLNIDRSVRNNFTKLQNLLLPAHDKHLLSLALPRLLKKDKVFKEAWLRNATMVINGHCQAQWIMRNANAQMIRGMQQRMRQFLSSTS